ncbi:hypothetical protein OQJ68_09400 [Microbulbifer thermotolerans]|uniref:Uncharacterized protein n=1 Tax=Microbulbifer thermotolerans TaxID=252514 RepID=A0AB35HYL3_MICTH|nr:hypothetical protein [Microbulbifer thermotolerans]MCX2802001.1 hypothetical protein [Microbulbifer thermotolerans]
MNKALYLAIVFLLPVVSVLIPMEHFQDIWVWIYVPLGLAYATYIWFQPNEHMMKFIMLAPLFFLIAVLVIFPAWAAIDSGLYAGLQFLGVVAIIAIQSSIIVGVTYVLLAYGIYVVFKKYGLLPANS